jgi:hypothetical protein
LNKQIAADLGTREKTIKVHRARVMAKMNARSLPELVRAIDRLNTENEKEKASLGAAVGNATNAVNAGTRPINGLPLPAPPVQGITSPT